MAEDYSQAAALKLAKETVYRLEQEHKGDPNKIAAAIMRMQEKNPLSAFPTSAEIFTQRTAELARTYAHVSDGAGGISGSKQAISAYRNTVAGMMPDGNGFALSQRAAIHAGRPEHLVAGIHMPKNLGNVLIDFAEDGLKGVAKNGSKAGLAGKAFAAAAGISVTVLSGNASAQSLTEAGLNGVSNGLGTLTVGDSSGGGNRLCKIFGDVVVPGAAGIGVGLVATPIAGIAASAAASVALSEPSTKACNSFAQKLGF